MRAVLMGFFPTTRISLPRYTEYHVTRMLDLKQKSVDVIEECDVFSTHGLSTAEWMRTPTTASLYLHSYPNP